MKLRFLIPVVSGIGGGGGGVGTLGISGWGCAAGTLEPLAYTRATVVQLNFATLY